MSLTLVDQHDLHDGIQRYVDLVRAHAVGAARRRSIVAVAELLRRNVVQLRNQRRRRRHVRDLIDQRDEMIAAGRGQKPIVRVRHEQIFGPVEVEAERQKDLDVGPLDQHALVAFLRVLQVADADGVGALAIANGVQRIHDLSRNETTLDQSVGSMSVGCVVECVCCGIHSERAEGEKTDQTHERDRHLNIA